MSNWHSWLFWPDNVALSILVLITLAMLFMYAAREPMHGVIHSLCNLVTQSTRFISRWLFLSADNLRIRNQSVLLAHSKESVVTEIDREFERVTNIVHKDMQEFPTLQRKLMEELTRIAAAQADRRINPHRRRLPQMRRGSAATTGMGKRARIRLAD